MSAANLLKDGNVTGALEALQAEVRANPADPHSRVLLFQLLCLEGAWSRAVGQLKTCVTLDPATEPMAQMYREVIVGEVMREKVFAGQRAPVFGGDEASWLPVLWDALKKEEAGERPAAQSLRAYALRAAPATAGTLNGEPFDWLADADPRLGPVLEVITGGCYQWLPYASLSALKIEPPRDLRDLVWTPVTLTYLDGSDALGLIPTRYPGTTAVGSGLAKLARATDWSAEGGLGQRMLCTDQTEIPLLEAREITLDHQPTRNLAHG